MKHRKFALGIVMFALVLSLSEAAGLLASAPEAAVSTGSMPGVLLAEPGWEQANSDGFGDPDAVEVTALAVFNSYLYAGTHNATDGALILRSPDGVTWAAVIDPGFGNPHDTAPPAIADLTVFGTYLYASTGRGQDPAKIWRTSNGTYWAPVVNNGFSNADVVDITVLAEYDGMLYASATNRVGGAEIWRSYTGDSNSWTQDSPATLVAEPAVVTGLSVFDGALYAAIESDGPAQIWRTYGGSSGWAAVVSDGFGDEQTVFTGGMAEFGGYLYAGAGNTAGGAQLWRTADGTTWEPAITPAFGDPNNEKVAMVFVYANQLYAGVANTVTGIEVWQSADGVQWAQSNVDGFGDANNKRSNGSNAAASFAGFLYVGTGNELTGGELWRLAPTVAPAQKVYLPMVQRLPVQAHPG